MKKLLLITGVLFTLISCKENEGKDSITKFAVSESKNTLDKLTSLIYEAVKKEGNRSADLKVLAFSQKLENFRINYIKTKNKESLIAYSDTVLISYNYFLDKGDQISNQIVSNRQLVLTSEDSSNQLNLFFWTLKAEEAIQIDFVKHIGGITDYFSPVWLGKRIEMILNKEKFRVGDTVYATFQMSNENSHNLKFNFDSLIVRNTVSKQKIPRTILKLGPFFIIQTVPNQMGKYSIEGEIKIHHFAGQEFKQSIVKSFSVN